MRLITSLFVLMCFVNYTFGQIQIDLDNTNLEDYPSLFLGPNFEISNVTLSGDDNQLGLFLGINSNVGLDLGLVLGTGDARLATGANFGQEYGNGGNNSLSGTLGGGNFGFGDADLEQLAGVDVNDAIILEFDFVPQTEQMEFDFVFASEEYNEYVCGTVNDAFGFFVSGPGINGGGVFENNAINLATVPNTNPEVPITVNTVNLGEVGGSGQFSNCSDLDPNWQSNSIYFTDNSEISADLEIVEYDGFTIPISASLELEIGETYHMKIAIADGSDTAWDSAVFIKSSTQAFVWPSVVGFSQDLGDSTMVEGCLNGSFDILLTETVNLDEVAIQLGGTAVMGIDYENVDLSVSQINNGVITIPINTIEDSEIEALESVELILSYSDQFGETQIIEESLYINDYVNVDIEIATEYVLCEEELILDATPIVGIGPFDYNWSSNNTSSSMISITEGLDQATVEITDFCGQTLNHEFSIIQEELFLVESQVTICAGDSITIIDQGNPPYQYSFPEGSFTLENDLLISSEGDYSESVSVTDACGYEESILITVETCTSVEEISELRDFELIAVGSTLTINASNAFRASEISIYDLTGRVVVAQPWRNSETNTIDISPLAVGQYVVSLSAQSGESISKKFFKQ